ncbi:hypothetical protein ACGFI3_46140 [Nonomuraea wenchangensis]|uniref:hypothetical protein n=1 Tax=Nonomuraea wenchangensis TaxID=568860 RepID=UPI0037238CE6
MRPADRPNGEESAAADYEVRIGGDAHGHVVVGNQNLVVDARNGSTINVVVPGRQPRPERRTYVSLLPRRQQPPLSRDTELAALEHDLTTHSVVQIYGPPGSGTSILLRHAARHLPPGPHGVVFLDAAGHDPRDLPQMLFEACYDTQGYAPTNIELRRLMAGMEITVYIDHADFSRKQVLALLETAPDAAFVLVGKQRTLHPDDGALLEVRGIGQEAGLELLSRALRRPLTDDERPVAVELWRATDGIPLRLVQAAAAALSGAVRQLPRPGEVAELVPVLLRRLDTLSTDIVRLLAAFGDVGLSPDHIGSITGFLAADRCRTLAERGLLTITDDGTYRCAANVVAEVRRLPVEPFPAAKIGRHFATWLCRPGTTSAEVAQVSDALERAATLLQQAGHHDLAVRITRAATPSMARSLRFGAWGRLLERGRDVSRAAGDRSAEAYFTHEQAIRNLLAGRRVAAAALLYQAVLIWRELGDTAAIEQAEQLQQALPPADVPLDAVPPETVTMPPPDPGTYVSTPPQDAATASTSISASTASEAPQTAPAGPSVTTGTTVPGPASTTGAKSAKSTSAAARSTRSAASRPTRSAASAGSTAAGSAGATAGAGAGTGGGGIVLAILALIGIAIFGPRLASTIKNAVTESRATPTPTYSAPNLAGVWSTPTGNIEIVPLSAGHYYIRNRCGTTRLSGFGNTYTGTENLYDVKSSCSRIIGTASVRVSLMPSGKTATYSVSNPQFYDSQAQYECYSRCTTEFWTRVSTE